MTAAPNAGRNGWRALLITVCLAGLSALLMAAPAPAGLSPAGQRVLAVAVLAIGLWCTDVIPAAVTGLLVVIALTLSGGVPGLGAALVGFAEPVAYFLIGVLTIGLAVSQSGLAERVALFFLRRCRGSSRALYLQLLLSFPLLTLLLPSATTRTGILIHVYEQALDLSGVPRGAPLVKAVMLALNSTNRLASTVLLTGGITPVLAASLIGGISWSRWFVLMVVPYGALLTVGALLIYGLYRKGFRRASLLPAGRGNAPLLREGDPDARHHPRGIAPLADRCLAPLEPGPAGDHRLGLPADAGDRRAHLAGFRERISAGQISSCWPLRCRSRGRSAAAAPAPG